MIQQLPTRIKRKGQRQKGGKNGNKGIYLQRQKEKRRREGRLLKKQAVLDISNPITFLTIR
jgi:hypothetical protein